MYWGPMTFMSTSNTFISYLPSLICAPVMFQFISEMKSRMSNTITRNSSLGRRHYSGAKLSHVGCLSTSNHEFNCISNCSRWINFHRKIRVSCLKYRQPLGRTFGLQLWVLESIPVFYKNMPCPLPCTLQRQRNMRDLANRFTRGLMKR